MPMLKETMLKRLLLPMVAAGGGGSAPVQDTATGNPLVFFTNLARPLKSLEIPFSPRQTGSGDPSPSNIRPIIPWDGLTVGRINGTAPVISDNAGMENVNGEWKNTGTDTKTRFDAYIQLYKGSTYIKGAGSKSITSSGVYSITFNVDDADCNRIVFLHSGSRNNLSVKFPFELSQGTYTINFNVVSANPSVVGGLAIKDIFLVAGEDVQRTETDISFPSPVYGGEHEAVSGRLAGRVFVDASFKWGDATSRTVIGNVERRGFVLPSSTKTQDELAADVTARFCSVAPWKYNYSSDDVHFYGGGWSFYVFLPVGTDEDFEIQIVAERPLQPQEIQLTPQQITAIVGNNTIWSDADGSMTAIYLKKG